VTFESTSLAPATHVCDARVGLSPDQAEPTSALSRAIRLEGFEPVAAPHAAEKIAAVLSGRCSSAAYVPSAKSPTWRSWDLAAGIALAVAGGLLLTTADGASVTIDDLDVERDDAWICSRDPVQHAALADVVSRMKLPASSGDSTR
jgi:3'-phosphoadenosine 5'-phosphosulfate (PAPS) 3'-phosphatase